MACGTRTLLAATFGPTSRGETRYALDLISAMKHQMIVLADRNFDAGDLIGQIAATGADVLIRAKTGPNGRKLPVLRRLHDGSYISHIGPVQVRVIDASITITTTTVSMLDIVGVIGQQVLADLLPPRRSRSAPRVVKRAISNYAPHTASGRLRGPSRDTNTRIDILTGAPP